MIKKLDACRLCQSDDFRRLFTKCDFEIVKCVNCGFVFLDFDPNEKFIKNYYSEDFFNDQGAKHGFSDYEGESKILRRTFAERIETLREHMPSGRLLDIGCATGTFMETASRYWDVSGLEISEYASQKAREKNLKVFTGDLDSSPFTQQKFDLITMWDTIEHLAHPTRTFKTLTRMMSSGSIIALTTGDVSSLVPKLMGKHWHLYNIPQHLSYFDQKSVTLLLHSSGFKDIHISYPNLNFSLDYLLFRLTTFYKLDRLQPLYHLIKRSQLSNLNIKVNLFDIMLVIAQKQ